MGQTNMHADAVFRVRDATLAGYKRREQKSLPKESGEQLQKEQFRKGVQDEENLA